MLKQNFSVSLLLIIVISSQGPGLARTLSPPPFPPMDGVVSPASPSPPSKSTTSPPPPFRPSPSGAGNKIMLKTLGAGIGIGGATVLVFVGIIVFWCKRRKRRVGVHGEDGVSHGEDGGPSSGQPLSGSSFAFGKISFLFAELVSATGNFSKDNLLGEGGFGCVHKGILPDGKEVAVKQLKEGSNQGEREFQREVETISRVHHKHLVSLVGFCWSGSKRLLVYTFVRNRTLQFHLHGKEQPTMNWATRMKIALGCAKALAYLHDDCQPKIIHRDIKASNILLDDNFQPKVADFGLAKGYDDDDDDVTHISTRVMGSFGYLAPEYAQTGRLTDKSDVFSFGVVLLELISGRRPINNKELYLDYDNIVDWARPLLRKALDDLNVATVADPRLQSNYDRVEMFRMVVCASVCVRISARIRPKMSQIVLALEGNISFDELKQGVTPGDSAFAYYGSLDDQKSYKENLEIFRKMVLEGREKIEVQPGNREGGQMESEVPG